MLSDIGREIADAKPLPSSVCTVIKPLNRSKETAVFLCRLPLLRGRSRKIVTVKEHIARVECTQREIWRGIARTRIERDGLIRSTKKTRALPREIIDFLRDLRRHGRIEKRRQYAQRRSALSHKEVDACTQKDRIGLVRRTRPALLPRLHGTLRIPLLNAERRQETCRLRRLIATQLLDAATRFPHGPASKRRKDTVA